MLRPSHRSLRASGVALPLLLALLGSGPCERRVVEIGTPTAAGVLPVHVEWASTSAPATDAAGATVVLDGIDVTGRFAAGEASLVG